MVTKVAKIGDTHPWITFDLDLRPAGAKLWMALGEAQSKCEHVAGIPLRPDTALRLHRIYLAKGVLATTAIEGNTLSEDEVLDRLDGKLELPSSREYLGREVDNIAEACDEILHGVASYGEDEITPEDLKRYNEMVLKGLDLEEDVVAGEVRKDERVVGRYKCPPAEQCQSLLENFCRWMNSGVFTPAEGHEIVYGLIRAIVAHVYFVWIHPFGDGNGRTARLVEVRILLEAGVPTDAAHLLSNHYNQTRIEYYRQLDQASKSGSNLLPFIEYAVRGFVDQLREQIDIIRFQQLEVTWINYVHDQFRHKKSSSNDRRKRLVLALSRRDEAVPKNEVRRLTPELAEEYAEKTPRTVSRDLNTLLEMDLIRSTRHGYVVNKERILAFLPTRIRDQENEEDSQPMPRRQRQLKLF